MPLAPTPTTDSAGSTADDTPRRLHPASPIVDAVAIVPRLVIPLVVVASREPLVVVPFVLVGIIVVVAFRYLAWTRTTYAVTGDSLVVEGGLVSRSRRVVPLDRVQQVDLQRKLRHRALGLVVVRIDTAGGGSGPEVALDSVSEAEAARLRQVLGDRRIAVGSSPVGVDGVTDEAVGAGVAGDGGGGQPMRTGGPPSLTADDVEVLRIGVGRLALAGVTGSKLAVVFAALGFVYGVLDDVVGDVGEQVADAVVDGARPGGLVLVAGALVAVPFWLASAAGAAILTDGGFRLTRRGAFLHVRRGLLDQREATLAVHRVQVVRIRQNALRRLLGLASVTLQSAGGAGPVEGEDSRVTVPILRWRELDGLLAQVLPSAPPLPALRPAPPAARRRAWVRRLIPATLVAAPVTALLWPVGGLALLVLPVAAAAAELAYRGLGWAAVADHVVTRQGGLLRETAVVPVAKVQSARLTSSPFQRRAGLATLLVDVAGRGRTPAVVDATAGDVDQLRHRALDAVAARGDERAVRRGVAVAASVATGPAGADAAPPLRFSPP